MGVKKIRTILKDLIIKTTFTKMSLNLNCNFYLHIQNLKYCRIIQLHYSVGTLVNTWQLIKQQQSALQLK